MKDAPKLAMQNYFQKLKKDFELYPLPSSLFSASTKQRLTRSAATVLQSCEKNIPLGRLGFRVCEYKPTVLLIRASEAAAPRPAG